MVQSNRKHIEEDVLELYAMGKLAEPEVEPVEEHLLICHHCQDQLAEADNYIQTFRAAAKQLEAKPVREPILARFGRLFKMPRFAMVPALAAVAAIVVMVRTYDTNQSLQTVELRALRNAESAGTAAAGKPIQLKLGAEGLSPENRYQAEIVDERGGRVFSGETAWAAGWLSLKVDKKLEKGLYWVRLSNPAETGKLIREYQLVTQ